jgi:excisionase family DNA binding protein
MTDKPFAAQGNSWRGFAEEQLLLTTGEAARALHVGRTTVYALISEGAIRPVHIGRSCRVSLAELRRYVAALQAAVSGSSDEAEVSAGGIETVG